MYKHDFVLNNPQGVDVLLNQIIGFLYNLIVHCAVRWGC